MRPPKMPGIGLLDLDPLVYSSAFAAQHKRYVAWDAAGDRLADFRVEMKGGKDWRAIGGDKKVIATAYARPELMEAVKIATGATDLEEYLHVEPVDHAMTIAKTAIQYVIKHTNCQTFQGVLTSSPNFRDSVATIKRYKGNRVGSVKPVHYHAMREYFQRHWGAIVVSHYEADDYISIIANREEDHIVASIDKDLKMIPGWHFINKKGVELEGKTSYITQAEALSHFFKQLLAGDTCDNIPGIKGIAMKTATKKLEGLDLQGQWEVCQNIYEATYGEEVTYPHWKMDRLYELEALHLEGEILSQAEAEELCQLSRDPTVTTVECSWREVLEENAILLWMVRSEHEPQWNIPWFEEEVLNACK